METTFPSPASAADPDYYLTNFFLVLDTVELRDEHLFVEEERRIFKALRELPEPARRLWVRIYNRRGPWFRVPRLEYREIEGVASAADCLHAKGLAEVTSTFETPQPVMETLTVEELRELLVMGGMVIPRSVRRADVVQKVTEQWEVDPELRHRVGQWGPWISIRHRVLIDRVVRLFFLNGGQGPGTLVAVDLAHISYPNYVIRRSRPVFPSREQLLAWEEAQAHEQALWQAAESGDGPQVSAILLIAEEKLAGEVSSLHPFLARFEPGWVWCRCLGQGVHLAERGGQYSLAVRWLRLILASPWETGRRGDRWERLALDLTHLGMTDEAISACEQALLDPALAPHHRVDLGRRLSRLRGEKVPRGGTHGRRRAPVERRFLARVVGMGRGQRTLFEGQSGQPTLVEQLALERYAGEGWTGIHSENLLFTSLFGLLLWDVIFADVPDVFQTPWQDAPLDLGTEIFLITRESDFNKRIDDIKRGGAPLILEEVWRHRGHQCRGVFWELLPREQLIRVCTLLGGTALAGILTIMAEDYRRQSRGFPDLCLWRDDALRLVEVKGPRDQLSGEQQLWQQRLTALGLDVELCLIEEEPAPSAG